MFNIENLLKKFRNISPPDEFVKNEIIEVFSKKINITPDKKKIKIIGNIAYIDTTPAVKSFIFIGKKNLLDEINSRLNGKGMIKDIR